MVFVRCSPTLTYRLPIVHVSGNLAGQHLHLMGDHRVVVLPLRLLLDSVRQVGDVEVLAGRWDADQVGLWPLDGHGLDLRLPHRGPFSMLRRLSIAYLRP